MFYKNGDLEIFSEYTAKDLQWSHIFNKVSCLQPATLLRKDSIASASLLLILGVFKENVSKHLGMAASENWLIIN